MRLPVTANTNAPTRPAPRSGGSGAAVELAEKLARACAARGPRDPIAVPMAALATRLMLMGEGEERSQTLARGLATVPAPVCADAVQRMWLILAGLRPYLVSSVRTLTGWLDSAHEHPQDLRAFQACLTILADTALEPILQSPSVGGDILGPVYSVLRAPSSRQALGAVYTPAHLSSLIAMMLEDKPTEDDVWAEPACGTGGMVVAAIRKMREAGEDVGRVRFDLSDVDPFAVALAGVNLAVLNIGRVRLRVTDVLADA